MGVSGQFYVPTVLPAEEKFPKSINRGLREPQSRSGRFGEEAKGLIVNKDLNRDSCRLFWDIISQCLPELIHAITNRRSLIENGLELPNF